MQVGGGNLVEKAAAVYYLASSADGLIFVGNMAFQIMHALGFPVPRKLIEAGAFKEAVKIIKFANSRNIPILFPKDFWCMKDHLMKPELVPAHSILEGTIFYLFFKTGMILLILLSAKACLVTLTCNVRFS